MGESTAGSLVLFFYLSFMDDELSLRLARAAADDLAGSLISDGQDPSVSEFIAITWKHFQKNIQLRQIKKSQVHPPYFLNLRPELHQDWYGYWKHAGPEEMVSLIWVKILGFSEQEVAQALGSTAGTINHRVSNGLSHCGSQLSL